MIHSALFINKLAKVLPGAASMPTVFLSAVFSTWSSNLAGRREKSHGVRKTSSD